MKTRKILIRMVPNLVSIIRVILTIEIIWICHDEILNFIAILSLTILIFLTDILDGKLARKLHSETRSGEILDVIADMGYVSSMSLILSRRNIISDYFLILAGAEFIIFIWTSGYLNEENRYLVFDVAGRILAVLYYVIPIVMYIAFLKCTVIHRILYRYGFITLIPFTLIVVIYRISLCRRSVKGKCG